MSAEEEDRCPFTQAEDAINAAKDEALTGVLVICHHGLPAATFTRLPNRDEPERALWHLSVKCRLTGDLVRVTAADRAKAASDAARFSTVSSVVRGQAAGPFVAGDGQAIETVVAVNLDKNGWNAAGTSADSIRAIAQADAHGLAVHIADKLGTAADSAKSFKGINGTLLFATLAIVIVLLLITYRSPVLWLLPVISAAVALFTWTRTPPRRGRSSRRRAGAARTSGSPGFPR